MRGSVILMIIGLFSCSKEKDYDLVSVYGHAGMGMEISNSMYHDNSKESVELALGIEGCDGVEVDVQLDGNGELWLFHDSMLDEETNSTGCIPNLTTAELQNVSYATFEKEKLIRLTDLDLAKFSGKELFLDIRHLNECTGQFVDVSKVIDRLKSLGMLGPDDFTVYCILGNPDWIQAFLDEGFNVIYSIYSFPEFENYATAFPDIDGFILRNQDVSKEEVGSMRLANKKVFIFELRSPKGIRKALRKLPDGVITDDIRTTLIEKY